MNAVLISLCAFGATFLGGFFALWFKDKLHIFLGFSAGAVIGVAFFDLIPESIELTSGVRSVSFIMTVVVVGFLLYMILDRFVFFHSHSDEDVCVNTHHEHVHADGHSHSNSNSVTENNPTSKNLKHVKADTGAGTLSIHSFLDGLAIGFAFKVSPAVGLIITAAVLAHDFSDGINTVNLVIRGGGTHKRALRWLLVDALAPVLGATTSLFFAIPKSALGLPLALFAGFFLYIGASDLLPESHHGHSMKWTTLMTVLGVAVLYIAIQFAQL